ncbi:MAG: hypothetical protein IT210_22520 [Armatimonadetes bacterium]|nr:hypothetical protein [Armatimonadota bacterium]
MSYPITREARLLEAGEYPDKQLTVSEGDLDAIAASFESVPVRIEHRPSPFDLGCLESVWRRGKVLMGRLRLRAPAWSLMQECGARKLSVCLDRDPLHISEVSVVACPRVPEAAVMSAFLAFETDLPEAPLPDAESELARLKASGKIAPAAESLARALLLAESAPAAFSGEPGDLPSLFRAFLDAQPPAIPMAEIAPSTAAPPHAPLYTRLGVTPEQVEKYSRG